MGKERILTFVCVAAAGALFIPAAIFDIRYLVPLGAFFDWLPVATGWMKARGKRNRFILLHIILTLIAYSFAFLWIFTSCEEARIVYRFMFLEIWWLAVILGILALYISLATKKFY
jgi:hypothetical protein